MRLMCVLEIMSRCCLRCTFDDLKLPSILHLVNDINKLLLRFILS